MSRNVHGQYAKRKKPAHVMVWWLGTAGSLLVLYVAATAVQSTFASFRSCNANNGLQVVNCGKTGLNFGDLILIGLLIAAAALTVSTFTHAWRQTKGLK